MGVEIGGLQHDLGAAIAHVVGQGVVALSAGCEIHLAVDPHPGGKSFNGNCWIRHPAGEIPGPLRRAIAVAGGLAELAFERGAPEEIEPVDAFRKLRSGELALSASEAAMSNGFTLADVVHATEDEVAAVLSKEEGRTVTVHEVRRIEFTALRKLRRLLQARGLRLANLLPED